MNDAATGHASRFLSFAYARLSPCYDLLAWWGFLPLGGERRCRGEFVRWLDLAPGHRVASLCCGTGSMERAMLVEHADLAITGVDLGRGQIARARSKVTRARHELEASGPRRSPVRSEGTKPRPAVTYLLADAARTGLPSGAFDRVLISLALHEMPRPTRLAVLREARRLCAPEGRVLAIEHGRPRSLAMRLLRGVWWFAWIPDNPEVATSRDLQASGLDEEMRASGLEPIARHETRPDWIEAFLARPARPA